MPNYAKTSMRKGKAKATKSNQTITSAPKKKTKTSKGETKKVFRVSWFSAAPFLMNGFQLLKVKTRGKEMIAEMHAPDKTK